MRRPVQLAAVVLAVVSAMPAHADDAQKGLKAGAQFTGVIASTATMSASQSGTSTRTGYEAAAACGYVAVVTPNNRMTVEVLGNAAGVGPSTPLMTAVTCEVATLAGDSTVTQLACGGNACATTAITGPWKVGEVSICVSAETWFGNSSQPLRIERTCNSVL